MSLEDVDGDKRSRDWHRTWYDLEGETFPVSLEFSNLDTPGVYCNWDDCGHLTTAQARLLGLKLIELADHVDKWWENNGER